MKDESDRSGIGSAGALTPVKHAPENHVPENHVYGVNTQRAASAMATPRKTALFARGKQVTQLVTAKHQRNRHQLRRLAHATDVG